ncbi:MAG: nucleotidyltransferase domain-containing protein [Patescibacteria group bacterium]
MEHNKEQNELFYALNHFLNSPTPNPTEAERITKNYKKLWPGLTGTLTAAQTIEIEKLEIGNYGQTKYAQILSGLKKYFENNLKKEIASLIIHGSVATMDWTEGFSDLDTFVIIRKDICENSSKLEVLRQKISAVRGLLKKADPLEHHGFIFCHEGNLNYYHQRFMPVEVFRYAKVLFAKNSINFHIRDSRQEDLENFEHYYQIFKKIAATGKISNKPGSPEYQLKWFVAMLLLMPSIYLQAKGTYVYKKFAFDLARHPFLKKLELARKDFRQTRKILGENCYRAALAMLNEWRKELEKSQTKFANHPKNISLKVYDAARREMVGGLSKNPDVLGVYEYGSVSAPGVSDIDPITVLRKNLINKWRNPDGPNIRKVAKGGLMIMPEEVFKKILWLDDLKIKRLHGKGELPRQPSKKIAKLRDLANVVDWLPERMIRLIMILKKNPMDVQYALRYTRSFAYSLENTAKIIGRKKESDEFLARLQNLRKKWRPERSSELQEVVRVGLYLGYDILNEFTKKIFSKPTAAEGRLTLFPGQEIVFTNNQHQISPDWSFAQSQAGDVRVFVSSALLPHFDFYARQGGIIGAGFRKNLVTSKPVTGKLSPEYQKFLKEKMAIANANAKFLRNNRFKSGQYKFGFYL